MKKRLGKIDLAVLAAILIVICFAGVFTAAVKKPGETLVISLDGEIYREVSLNEDQRIEIKKEGVTVNVLDIRDGKADMKSATCPDKLCVHQNPVSKSGESIVCLPNKVVVEVKGEKKGDFDSIAR